MATSATAQDLQVFSMPNQGMTVTSFSSSSALGSDGQMHTMTHKVTSETSPDGMQKRVSELDCKDGDCAKSVSFMGPGFMSSMMPNDFFKGMPPMMRMPRFVADMEMPRMHHMRERMERMRSGCHHMMNKIMQSRPMSSSMHFLAPRMAPTVVVLTDGQDPRPPPPMYSVSSAAHSESEMGASEFAEASLAAVALIGMSFTVIMTVRTCCFGKKGQARERRLQDLGAPLAPEAQAEMGMAAGVVIHAQAVAVPAKDPATAATQAYMSDVYGRAALRSSKKLANAALKDIYEHAVDEALAASA
eukprot:TRINITY_DN67964_c0_g1_i1.p1 TRINITY_DN67964_c0_g1~~TRINITY_DN67964_c0_g1_i1.p1  ORF type:complete len:342 (+),score=83.56 TRINITY_DN67964_c0_g1_i1:122-1027(+)